MFVFYKSYLASCRAHLKFLLMKLRVLAALTLIDTLGWVHVRSQKNVIPEYLPWAMGGIASTSEIYCVSNRLRFRENCMCLQLDLFRNMIH